jgi:NAD(P)-dependent dehydrogenase (short-subunit alcohol dehydrogenase family)
MSMQSHPQSGKVALVTGSSRGIGAGIATRLARSGAHVIINYRAQSDAAERLVQGLRVQGLAAEARQADVADPLQVAELFRRIGVDHGRLDILVNDAGINRDGPFLDMTLDQWDAVVATNLRGAFVCAQHAARLMLQNNGGVIINIGATTGVSGRSNGINYCAAKAGLMVMTRCLALELAPRIRVNTVVPGLVPTDETNQRFALLDPETAERKARETPLQRLGTCDDIALAVSFLCSEDASWITGQALPVTGGKYMNA